MVAMQGVVRRGRNVILRILPAPLGGHAARRRLINAKPIIIVFGLFLGVPQEVNNKELGFFCVKRNSYERGYVSLQVLTSTVTVNPRPLRTNLKGGDLTAENTRSCCMYDNERSNTPLVLLLLQRCHTTVDG